MPICSHCSKDTVYFVNIDAHLPGQMSKGLDPASISHLCHRTTEHYVPKRLYFISRHDGERTSRKICITTMVNFSNNEESVNIIIYFVLLLKRHLKINSNVLHNSDSGLNGAIGKSGRGQRTWTWTRTKADIVR